MAAEARHETSAETSERAFIATPFEASISGIDTSPEVENANPFWGQSHFQWVIAPP